MHRSSGIIVLAIACLLAGLLGILAGISLLSMASAAADVQARFLLPPLLLGIVLLVCAILQLAGGVGLFLGRSWPAPLLVVALLSALVAVLSIVADGSTIGRLLILLLDAAIALLLLVPGVRRGPGRT